MKGQAVHHPCRSADGNRLDLVSAKAFVARCAQLADLALSLSNKSGDDPEAA